MHLLDRAAEHRRNGIKRADDDGDAHAPDFVFIRIIRQQRPSFRRSRFASPQAPIENFKRDQRFGAKPLQRVIPAGPAIQDAAFDKQGVKQHADWREPAQTANAVTGFELYARRFDQMTGLYPRVTLLRIEPARQRFSVVVIDDPGERHDFTVDRDAVAVTFIAIARFVLAVEHGPGRVERSAQSAAMNAIDEPRPVAGYGIRRVQPGELLDQSVAELVIGIERQHPWRIDQGEAEIALAGEIAERMPDDVAPRESSQHVTFFIRAAAVDHDDPFRPRQLTERARDIWRLVVGD